MEEIKRGSLMNESILTSIKAQLGIQEEYTAFDQQIVMHINSVLMVLKQGSFFYF